MRPAAEIPRRVFLRAAPTTAHPRESGDPEFFCGMSFYVYITASRRNGTLYIGMTDDLGRRMWEHETGAFPGFTKKYGVKTLVWFEVHETRESAFRRERQIKKWNRKWKLELIENQNPQWHDLVLTGRAWT
jgi:putative endonuclease